MHLWVGGSMLPGTSPNDPIFFLHHCNVDRLLSQWQKLHPMEVYHPTGTGTETHPIGEENVPMIFHFPGEPAPWAAAPTTPAQLWHHHLSPSSYWYDTDSPEVQLLTPSVSFVDVPEGVGGTGVTTYRPVRLAVLSCAGATFQITRFDDTAQTLFGVTDVGPVSPVTPGSGRDQALSGAPSSAPSQGVRVPPSPHSDS